MDNTISYAGFWKRFLAYLIDKIILSFATALLLVPLWIIGLFSFFFNAGPESFENYALISTQHNWDNEVSVGMITAFIFLIIIFWVINAVIEWLYFALFESSAKQATFGKMIVGIKVTDLQGNKISFGRATGRYFGKILSGFILGIGYLMAAFTERKQALHDILSSCLVVNKFNF